MMVVKLIVMLSPSGELEHVDAWIVVDVLRATTMMTAFFERGGKMILPVKEVEEAYSLKRMLGKNWLLMGERNSVPPPCFDCGNSPFELSRYCLETYDGAIMTTTNGTKALIYASSYSNNVFIGCARNATAALKAALRCGNNIGILCAGRHNRAMVDDTACAGLMVNTMKEMTERVDLNDGGKIAWAIWKHYHCDLLEAFKDAEHARRLEELGLWNDVVYASCQNKSEVVPRLTLWNGLKAVIV
ncbi:2-phosphosulfolactate phosphatase [Acetomicrobium flavidum]|uniref:2-phosphosulfolactate phosphatase n=1 Tax=Acetomicrobium flavidum TaxID=49896 RepID=UPI002BED3E04|nr:2-phosphosulfolactate phosphatase [Acetomicrobium flavidum]